MKTKTILLTAMTVSALTLSAGAWAQQQGNPERASQATQERQMERVQSRDRAMSADKVAMKDQERLQAQEREQQKLKEESGDKAKEADQLREQDRLQTQDQVRDRIHQDQEIFGGQMMTEQERLQYRERIEKAGSEGERERIRAEHKEQMMQRARERGVKLDEPTG